MQRYLYSIVIFVILMLSSLCYGDKGDKNKEKANVHDKQYIYGNVNKPTIPVTMVNKDNSDKKGNAKNDTTQPSIELDKVDVNNIDPKDTWERFMLDYTTYQQPFSIIGAEHDGENSHIAPTLSIIQIKSDVLQSVKDDDVYTLRTLIEYIGTPDFLDNYKRTALIYAAIYDSLDVMRLLIAMGADLNHKDIQGRTAAYYASLNQSSNAIALLAENGASFDMVDNDGITPIAILMGSNNYSLAQKVINLNIVDSFILSKLLMSAVKRDDLVYVKFLVSNKADVNIIDNDNNTPIIIASYHNNYDMADVLVKSGANLDVQDSNGSTALMIATLNGNKQLIDDLINAGANPSLRNHAGFSACDMGLNVNNDAPPHKSFLKPEYANNPMTPPKDMKDIKTIPHHKKQAKVKESKQDIKTAPVTKPPTHISNKTDQKIDPTIDSIAKKSSDTTHLHEDNVVTPKLNNPILHSSVEPSKSITKEPDMSDSTYPAQTSVPAQLLSTKISQSSVDPISNISKEMSSVVPKSEELSSIHPTAQSSAVTLLPSIETPTFSKIPSVKPSKIVESIIPLSVAPSSTSPTVLQQNIASTIPAANDLSALPPPPPPSLSK